MTKINRVKSFPFPARTISGSLENYSLSSFQLWVFLVAEFQFLAELKLLLSWRYYFLKIKGGFAAAKMNAELRQINMSLYSDSTFHCRNCFFCCFFLILFYNTQMTHKQQHYASMCTSQKLLQLAQKARYRGAVGPTFIIWFYMVLSTHFHACCFLKLWSKALTLVLAWIDAKQLK